MNYLKKTIKDIDVNMKKVLMRCDFNVPQDAYGNITDNKRILESLPSIKYLLEKKSMIILCSHLGRPGGKFNEKFSLKPIAMELKRLLNVNIKFVDDVIGTKVENLANNLLPGEILLLENVRFYTDEEKNDKNFAKKLASIAEIYVNDAFGTSHRAHASTEGVTHYLPSVCGLLIEKEINIMGKILENPTRPFLAILGGAKITDKIGVINNLLEKCDCILIGGAMAYTFLKASNVNIGNSLCENDKLEIAYKILDTAKKKNVKILLPIDHICSNNIENKESIITCNKIPDKYMAFDIGPNTIDIYKKEINKSKSIIWNGPMGVFEIIEFSNGTKKIAEAIANNKKCVSIIGGGDSVAAINSLNLSNKITHISTGGGASLEFLEGKELPGIKSLLDK